MAKVLGLGGIFFKAQDPKALLAWYQRALGVPGPDYAFFQPATMPDGAGTTFAPFAADTKYFAPSEQAFMFNFVVDDLDGALRQVEEAGGKSTGEVQDYSYGRFGWFLDPEGNKVELWQPKAKPAS